jgi:membrane-associated phospholipid phosphatase
MKSDDSELRNPRAGIPAKEGFFSEPGRSRRKFLEYLGGTTGVALAAGASPLIRAATADIKPDSTSRLTRAEKAYQIRVASALREKNDLPAAHPVNGDEDRYPGRIASYSKGLPHNQLGEVHPDAYDTLLSALATGKPSDFEKILLGGKLTNPQAGLAFEMQGPDSHAMAQPPAPAFSSAEEAAEIAENYWMALARDISFAEYETNPLTVAAAADLSRFSDLKVPKVGGRVTPATLFRGLTPGDVTGPYISQFLWLETPFGAETVDRRMRTTQAGSDHMTNYFEWLAVQDGAQRGSYPLDPTPRYIRNGRDLGEWVHIDVLFQAYFNAFLILASLGAPVDADNPYNTSRTQLGFGTFGGPYMASVLCAIARPALKAVWYQKWFVHRRLRPEEFAGRVHNHATRRAGYPIHPEILASSVLDEVFRRNRTFLLPMAFPEGAPSHPSYGAGHATVAGACVTVLKALFDESWVIPNPVQATPDGLALVPYNGPPLTVGGELNKLAANVAIGRDIAGVHWRSDATQSLKLGEEVAISYLREERGCFNERFEGLSLTTFDGRTITV